MEEELRSHILHRVDDLEHSGVDRFEATYARIEFGGGCGFGIPAEVTRRQVYDVLIQVLRFAVPRVDNSPRFHDRLAVALALAIGANAVVFAALNALMRPLNVPRAESLYSVHRWRETRRGSRISIISTCAIATAVLRTSRLQHPAGRPRHGENPSRAWLMQPAETRCVGIQPYLGRFFHASDEHGPNSAPYIVLSHAYWHSHFRMILA